MRERDHELNNIYWWMLEGKRDGRNYWPNLDYLTQFDRGDEIIQARYMSLVTRYRIWYRRARRRIRNWTLKQLEIATKQLPRELLQRIYTMSIQ